MVPIISIMGIVTQKIMFTQSLKEQNTKIAFKTKLQRTPHICIDNAIDVF